MNHQNGCNMAKNKELEKLYKVEGKRRNDLRKAKRKEKLIAKIDKKNNQPGCKICGEDPYCYCGDGTPYSY